MTHFLKCILDLCITLSYGSNETRDHILTVLRTQEPCLRQNLAYAKMVFLPPACVRTVTFDVATQNSASCVRKQIVLHSYLFCVRNVSRANALVYGIFTPPRKPAYRWQRLLKHNYVLIQSTQDHNFCHGHQLNIISRLSNICNNIPPSQAEVKECLKKRGNLSVRYCFSYCHISTIAFLNATVASGYSLLTFLYLKFYWYLFWGAWGAYLNSNRSRIRCEHRHWNSVRCCFNLTSA